MNTVNDEESRSQDNPVIVANLNYRFFRRLMFSSKERKKVSIKKYYDTLEYTGNANLVN